MTGRICGTGSALPGQLVTNDDLAKIMDTSDEWIKSRTGITSRHLAVGETTTALAAEAAERALENAGEKAASLDLIIAATVTPDKLFPSLACEVQREIGAENAVAFDISAGCSGFLFALAAVQAYIKSGSCKRALILGAEVLSKIMDWEDRSTCVLFGDGAGAAVVCADEHGIRHISQHSDGTRGMALTCENRPVNNPYHREPERLSYTDMNGQAVYRFAVKTVPESIREALREAGVTPEEVDCYILHQANIRIIKAVADRLGQPMEKFPTNIAECGNVSAASIPILLDQMNRRGRLKRGNKIVLAGFGAGLTWGTAVLDW